MFCLRSWLPLLFIPTNAAPAFIFLFFICTYFLNRPCPYCSVLLLILFTTSCNWSDRCFFDFGSNWFQPRTTVPVSSSTTTTRSCAARGECLHRDGELMGEVVWDMVNSTARAVAGAVVNDINGKRAEWTGLGIEWLRNLLGKREWRIESLDIDISL